MALLCNVLIRQGQKQSENQKQALPTTQLKHQQKPLEIFSFQFFATVGPPCVFYVTGPTLIPIEISGKQPTLGWNTVNPLL